MAETAVWEVGSAYEPYMGRWSRLVAREFLAWLGMADGAVWLDVGCGTGALSQTVLGTADPASLVGIDPSAGFVAYARAQLADRRARFVVANARRLPVGATRFDAVVSGLVLNFVPDPAAVELSEGRRFGLCQPEPLDALFQDAGLVEVEVRPIQVPTRFRDFDDYWIPFLGGQGSAPGYAMSLDEERRAALREELRSRLPAAGDGSIALVARAWVVDGRQRF